MPTKNLALRNKTIGDWADGWDQGANPSPSTIVIRRADTTILVTIPLESDAFGEPSAGRVSVSGAPSANAVASGEAATADIVSADGTLQITGITVSEAGGGGMVVVQNTSINAGQLVRISLLTWEENSDLVNVA